MSRTKRNWTEGGRGTCYIYPLPSRQPAPQAVNNAVSCAGQSSHSHSPNSWLPSDPPWSLFHFLRFPRILQMTFLFNWKFVSFLFSYSNSLPNRLLTDGKCFHSDSEGKESFYTSTRKKSGSSVSSVRHFLCGGFVSNRTSLRQLFKHQPPLPHQKPTIQLLDTVNRGIKNHLDLTSFSLQVL